MRSLLRFLVGPRAAWLPAILVALWALVILPVALWSLGAFAGSGFDTSQQTALSRALAGSDSIEAIAAAKVIGADFGDAMQNAVELSSSTFDRGKVLDPSSAALETGDAVQRGWVQRYVCGLTGWGDYRPLLRTLMLNGLGKCTESAKLRARSPILDGAPPIAGWLFFPVLTLLLVAPLLLALLLWKVRSAYLWLYSSSVIKPQPPLAAS